ncbi:MAG: hypothetical protein AB7D38_10800 [Sulfurimonas sp.]|uniref:hypothetical protein n=1 Tax=Sulfurimonas sp. TaxID=2022749 RepID=UPI003D14D1E0
MHTLKLQIQDDMYESIVSKGIDINHKLQEFIATLADDGYPAISTQEAKKRVADAVQRYRDGNGTYTPLDKDYMDEMHNYIQSL